MKKALLYFLFIVFSLQVTAQKIRHMDTSNKWLVYGYGGLGTSGYRLYTISGDTTINGKQYKYSNLWEREDTVLGKVYFIPGDDSNERVLYDYTLKVKDTFSVINTYFLFPKQTFKHIVTRLDSVLVQNVYHKIWEMTPVKIAGNKVDGKLYYIIEGIGSTVDPIFPFYPKNDAQDIRNLICFSNNGNIIKVPIPWPKTNDTVSITPGVCVLPPQPPPASVNRNAADIDIIIKPNPVMDELTVMNANGYHMLLCNITGQQVHQAIINSNKEVINMRNLPCGIYLLQLNDHSGRPSIRKKILKE